jgi:hypothetical protein
MRAFEQRPDVRALVTTYPTSEPWLKAGDGMMRKNEIDDALHEIQQMVEVAIRGAHSLNGAEHDKQKSEMPADDAQLLDFSLLDIANRVKALREIMEEPEPTAAIVRIGGNECA